MSQHNEKLLSKLKQTPSMLSHIFRLVSQNEHFPGTPSLKVPQGKSSPNHPFSGGMSVLGNYMYSFGMHQTLHLFCFLFVDTTQTRYSGFPINALFGEMKKHTICKD